VRRAPSVAVRAVLLGILAGFAVFAPKVAARAQQGADSARWASDLAAFEAEDRRNPPAPGEVLFVGSSSIRLWTTLGADFPRVRVVNRGFGGCDLADIAKLANRVVVPYHPRLVVLYAGDNDLAEGRTPAEVETSFRELVAVVHRALPGTRLVFVSIKPSLARVRLMNQVRDANRRVASIVRADSMLRYVDVFTPMLDARGGPRRELFQPDGLHMKAAGYAIWRERLTPLVR
jgi:lysophospholipase L1-like esterase